MASAIWMNGTAAQVEDPGKLSVVARRGWGTHFKQLSGSNWIHMPVGQVGLPMVVNVVFVLFRTTEAVITTLHIHDGFNVVKAFEGLTRSGDKLQVNDLTSADNAWPIDPTQINNGLGLSVQVEFGGAGRPGEILIAAAGAYTDVAPQSGAHNRHHP